MSWPGVSCQPSYHLIRSANIEKITELSRYNGSSLDFTSCYPFCERTVRDRKKLLITNMLIFHSLLCICHHILYYRTIIHWGALGIWPLREEQRRLTFLILKCNLESVLWEKNKKSTNTVNIDFAENSMPNNDFT